MPQTQQKIAKLLAERQQLGGLTTYEDAPLAISPDLIHKKKHKMHLMFRDLSVSTPTTDSSPQSAATLFTCIGSASDFEASLCSSESLSEYASSLNEHQNVSSDAENGLNVRFKRSVSDTYDRSQQESDFHTGSKTIYNVEEGLECQATVGPLEHRRVFPPVVFLFDVEESTFEPSNNEKIIISQGNDSNKGKKD